VNQGSINFSVIAYCVAQHCVMLESIESCAQLVALWTLIVSRALKGDVHCQTRILI
jgi:hypothetical protein